jgi:CheY-like chemotaxis protein
MPRLTERYTVDLAAELFSRGTERKVAVADLSRTGAFVRMSPPLEVGDPVYVAMYFDGRQLASPATVVHSLADGDARALGRPPGVGVSFDPPTRHADTLFLRAVDRLLAKRPRTAPELTGMPELHVVVGDPSTRMLERLSTELANAGCSVATATNGLEVIGAALRRTPDVVVVDRALPVIDGVQMIGALGRRAGLAHVPVIVMAHEASELATVFERGARDAIKKPFTSLELVARCHHVTRRPGERVILRGDLAEVGLPAILVMLEQERKSGRLALRGTGSHVAWLELAHGAICDAGSSQCSGDLRGVVMSVLDWTRGDFELVAAPPRAAGTSLPITHALLEHARISDERLARKYVA